MSLCVLLLLESSIYYSTDRLCCRSSYTVYGKTPEIVPSHTVWKSQRKTRRTADLIVRLSHGFCIQTARDDGDNKTFVMPDLLEICPHGAWVTEDQAVQILGFSSQAELKVAFTSGSLPHVYAEHGKRHNNDNIPEAYQRHRFFFIQKEGNTCIQPSISFSSWVNMCQSIENGSVEDGILKEYTDISNADIAEQNLKTVHGIVTMSELAEMSSADDDGGYRYGSNGGKVLAPSKASSFKDSQHGGEGEIYTRADGKKVRRIKKSSSSSGASLSGDTPVKKTLSGFLSGGGGGGADKSQSKLAKRGGSQSVAGGEGEVYVRADGKKGELIVPEKRGRVQQLKEELYFLPCSLRDYYFVICCSATGEKVKRIVGSQ